MAVKTWHNGNEVFYINEKWVHTDGSDGYNYKPCPVCGKLPHDDGRDACLQKIPGVTSACCGHGIEGLAVVVFENGEVIRGKEANEFLKEWKRRRKS